RLDGGPLNARKAMLEVRKLNQSYGQSHTLWDIDFTAAKGSCVALIGRNGVGKTTLLNCLMGLIGADTGSITCNGEDLTRAKPEARAPLGIGYVPQGRMIFPLLTVEENLRVGLPVAARRAGNRARKRIPDLVFELFPVLKSMLHR